jgi:hypothetical protein
MPHGSLPIMWPSHPNLELQWVMQSSTESQSLLVHPAPANPPGMLARTTATITTGNEMRAMPEGINECEKKGTRGRSSAGRRGEMVGPPGVETELYLQAGRQGERDNQQQDHCS